MRNEDEMKMKWGEEWEILEYGPDACGGILFFNTLTHYSISINNREWNVNDQISKSLPLKLLFH